MPDIGATLQGLLGGGPGVNMGGVSRIVEDDKAARPWDMLLNVGSAILKGQATTPLGALGDAAGAVSASRAQADAQLTNSLMRAFQMGQIKSKLDKDASLKSFASSLPENQRQVFLANPEKYLENYLARTQPKPEPGFVYDENGVQRVDPNYVAGVGQIAASKSGGESDARNRSDLRFAGAIEASKNPALIAREAGGAYARQGAEAAYAGPIAEARQAVEAKYAGPIAAGRAAGAFYGTPQKLEPGATLVQVPPPGGAAGGPTVVAKSDFPAPGTQQGKFEADVGGEQAATIKAYKDKAEAAAEALKPIDSQIALLNNGFTPGAGAGVRAEVSRLLQGFGVSEGVANALSRGRPDAYRLFQANSNEIVQSVAKSLGANPTDNDARILAQTLAQATDTPSAARAILEYKRSKLLGDVDKYKSAYDWTFNQKKDPLLFAVQSSGARAAASPEIRQPNVAAPVTPTAPAAPAGADYSAMSNEQVLNMLRQRGVNIDGR